MLGYIVDPSHDLFLNITKSSWLAVELVSKDQPGSRSELKHAFTQDTHCCLITLYNYCASVDCILCLKLPHLVRPTVKIGRA